MNIHVLKLLLKDSTILVTLKYISNSEIVKDIQNWKPMLVHFVWDLTEIFFLREQRGFCFALNEEMTFIFETYSFVSCFQVIVLEPPQFIPHLFKHFSNIWFWVTRKWGTCHTFWFCVGRCIWIPFPSHCQTPEI